MPPRPEPRKTYPHAGQRRRPRFGTPRKHAKQPTSGILTPLPTPVPGSPDPEPPSSVRRVLDRRLPPADGWGVAPPARGGPLLAPPRPAPLVYPAEGAP